MDGCQKWHKNCWCVEEKYLLCSFHQSVKIPAKNGVNSKWQNNSKKNKLYRPVQLNPKVWLASVQNSLIQNTYNTHSKRVWESFYILGPCPQIEMSVKILIHVKKCIRNECWEQSSLRVLQAREYAGRLGATSWIKSVSSSWKGQSHQEAMCHKKKVKYRGFLAIGNCL